MIFNVFRENKVLFHALFVDLFTNMYNKLQHA